MGPGTPSVNRNVTEFDIVLKTCWRGGLVQLGLGCSLEAAPVNLEYLAGLDQYLHAVVRAQSEVDDQGQLQGGVQFAEVVCRWEPQEVVGCEDGFGNLLLHCGGCLVQLRQEDADARELSLRMGKNLP